MSSSPTPRKPPKAARRATATVPIIMAIVADPVGSGVVTNLSQPGGNITGLSIMLAELSAKRLQLLKDAVPRVTRVTRVGVLWNPPTAYHAKALDNLKSVAPSLAIDLIVASALTSQEIDRALETVNRAHAEALYVVDCPPFFNHRAAIMQRAMGRSCPMARAMKTNSVEQPSTSTKFSKA